MASSPFLTIILVACLSFVSIICYAEAKNGITLDMIHRDSALSPSYDPLLTRFQRLRKSFDRSSKRKDWFKQAYLRATSAASPASFNSPMIPNGGSYLMKMSIGTPPVPVTVIADTGSDLFWMQCKPCKACYKQTAPLFDSSKSTTYKKTTCGSVCTQNNFACVSGDCKYEYGYGDGSYTIGDIATDTLTFTSKNGMKTTFPGKYMGCGRNNSGTFDENESGICGIGGGPISLVRQTSTGKFSYCMTSIDSDQPGKLNFGSDAVVVGPGVGSTPLVNKPPATFYWTTLHSASVVGSTRSSHEPTAAPVKQGNIIWDSGTTLTYLPSSIYNKLESDLQSAIKAQAYSFQEFDLCYYEDELPKRIPSTVFHFQGANFTVSPVTYLLEIAEGIKCVTILGDYQTGGIAIFGNILQSLHIVAYDLVKKTVSFKPTDCSKLQ